MDWKLEDEACLSSTYVVYRPSTRTPWQALQHMHGVGACCWLRLLLLLLLLLLLSVTENMRSPIIFHFSN